MKIWTAIFSALIISLTGLSLPGHAKEGFELNPPGHALDVAWNATFALTSNSPQKDTFVTSSVLIYKKIVGPSVYLGFLSSGHSMLRMLEVAPIQRILVSRNIRMIDQLELTETIPGQILEKPLIDMTYDLSFFMVRLNAHQSANYTPIEFSSACGTSENNVIYLFGFPGTFLRDVSRQREKISAPNLLIKRSSSGVTTDERQFGPDQTILYAPLIGTTADSLGGDSGGPAVDESGGLSGILVSSLASEQNDYSYQGFEGQQILRAHSFVTGCRVTEFFAASAWDRFLSSIGAKVGSK